MFQFSKNLCLQLRQNYTTDYRLLIIARNLEKHQLTTPANIKTRNLSKNKNTNVKTYQIPKKQSSNN